MICINDNCKHDIPDDSIFCPDCGTKQKETQSPRHEVPPVNESFKEERDNNEQGQDHYFIDFSEDVYEEDGFIYQKFLIKETNSAHDMNFVHGDDECDGIIYVGNNAKFICGKCGKRCNVIDSYSDQDKIFMNKQERHSQQEWLSKIGTLLLNGAIDLQWYQKFINSFNNSIKKL